MFLDFAKALTTPSEPTIEQGTNKLFQIHPSQLSLLLELVWQRSNLTPTKSLALPEDLLKTMLVDSSASQLEETILRCGSRIKWYHLIYAYMIENTRMYEIFRRVLNEFFHGEKLGPPDATTQAWLRTTEELFYSDPAPYLVTRVVSRDIRPDMRSSRRNAYYRMFGMDMNHGYDDGKPYPYLKADVANNDFVSAFEELLREVWLGYSNFANNSGQRPTDDSKMLDLVQKLGSMLRARREGNNIYREEFAFVTMMSWFHLTLKSDTDIVKVLRANADTPEQRLYKIAERVGLPAHGLSRSFFEIAEPISNILRQIELKLFDDLSIIPVLYNPEFNLPQTNLVATNMLQIITHWSVITGRNIKARPVSAN